jgi:hypothetical protein
MNDFKAITLSSGVVAAVLELRHVVVHTSGSVRLAPRHFASSRHF